MTEGARRVRAARGAELSCKGWVQEADIALTDEGVMSRDTDLVRWIDLARERVVFQGLPARICWLGYGDRARVGLFNDLVRTKKVGAPIVIGRDHLDCGSVASPYRETEAMKDGSDAIIRHAQATYDEAIQLGERARVRLFATAVK